MDIGNFVVGLVSMSIVASVVTFTLACQKARLSDERRPGSGGAEEHDYFGSNPLEDDYEADVRRTMR